MDVRAYNRRIREKKVELEAAYPSGYLHVTLNKGGGVSEVTCEVASRNLTDATHHISTPEEVAEYQRQNAIRRESLQRGESAKANLSLGIEIE